MNKTGMEYIQNTCDNLKGVINFTKNIKQSTIVESDGVERDRKQEGC